MKAWGSDYSCRTCERGEGDRVSVSKPPPPKSRTRKTDCCDSHLVPSKHLIGSERARSSSRRCSSRVVPPLDLTTQTLDRIQRTLHLRSVPVDSEGPRAKRTSRSASRHRDAVPFPLGPNQGGDGEKLKPRRSSTERREEREGEGKREDTYGLDRSGVMPPENWDGPSPGMEAREEDEEGGVILSTDDPEVRREDESVGEARAA
jgi:hypothetical protein